MSNLAQLDLFEHFLDNQDTSQNAQENYQSLKDNLSKPRWTDPLSRSIKNLLTTHSDYSEEERKMLEELRLERISPSLKLKVNKRARRMALRLDAKNRVVNLVVPSKTNVNKAYRFAKENKDWINEKISTLPVPIAFVHGAIIPIFGKKIRLVIDYDPELKTTDIQLKEHELIVRTAAANPSTRIRRFLQNKAKEKLTHLSQIKAKRLGRELKSVQVRDTVSRWGSCSEDGHISYSWRLIFAPTMAFDYVVAHEVAHLEYMDHSDDFWDICSWLSRGFHVGKDWMRDHGYELMRYGTEFPAE